MSWKELTIPVFIGNLLIHHRHFSYNIQFDKQISLLHLHSQCCCFFLQTLSCWTKIIYIKEVIKMRNKSWAEEGKKQNKRRMPPVYNIYTAERNGGAGGVDKEPNSGPWFHSLTDIRFAISDWEEPWRMQWSPTFSSEVTAFICGQ